MTMEPYETMRARVVKRQRERRRQENLNKTWRNPRFYILLLFLPMLLCISLPVGLVKLAGQWIEQGADYVEQFFIRLISPFHRWIDAGARKDGDA